jgi:hypothetical protein
MLFRKQWRGSNHSTGEGCLYTIGSKPVAESPPTYLHRGGWLSTSKASSATIPSWKKERRKRDEENKDVGRAQRSVCSPMASLTRLIFD